MGFSREELEAARGRQVDDLVGPGLQLLIVGINPGLWTAAANAHFARPGNRFYPALHAAGITDHVIDASNGMTPQDRAQLIARGVGITNLVRRATARADELTGEELRDGSARVARSIAAYRPVVVAFLGITAYRKAFRNPRARTGPQLDPLAGAQVWVVPNPSGLNAHETVDSLGVAYAAAAVAAGVLPADRLR